MEREYVSLVRYAWDRLEGSVRGRRGAAHLYARLVAMYERVPRNQAGQVTTCETRNSLIAKLNASAKKAKPLGRSAYARFESLVRAELIEIVEGEVYIMMPEVNHA